MDTDAILAIATFSMAVTHLVFLVISMKSFSGISVAALASSSAILAFLYLFRGINGYALFWASMAICWGAVSINALKSN